MTTTATDRHDTLEVTLEPSRRITRVRVHDIDRLRTPDALSSSLLGAFQAADGQLTLDTLEEAGTADDFLAEVERSFAERPGLRTPRVGDVSYAAYRADRLGGSAPVTPRVTVTGVSRNGYLRITRDADGGLLTVDADAAWLSGARTEFLEDAIIQATTADQDGSA